MRVRKDEIMREDRYKRNSLRETTQEKGSERCSKYVILL